MEFKWIVMLLACLYMLLTIIFVTIVWYRARQDIQVTPEEVNVNITVDIQVVENASWPHNCIRTTPRLVLPMIGYEHCDNLEIDGANHS